MRDCKLRCIRGSMEFTKWNIYTIKNDTLVGDENEFEIYSWYSTIEQINDEFEAQFEIVEEELQKPLDSLTLSEINSKYGEQCYDEIIEILESHYNPLDKVYIDVFKSIVGLIEGAYSISDGCVYNKDESFICEIKQNLPLGDKQYILQEEIDKYESANR